MDAGTLRNLASYTGQVLAIALIGSALPSLLRVQAPRARFFYWRALVLFCLALPWVQSRTTVRAVKAAISADATRANADTVGTLASALPVAAPIDWTAVAFAIISAGILLRLLWMAAGLGSLRRLRAVGHPVDDADLEDLQLALGTRADIRYVPGVRQPVTFGLRRPVVLLPSALTEHDPEIRRAVVAHELVHVQRHDWAWIVAEELVRAALWFNPAMWWLISRIQLAREEVVDATVVAITGKRRTYVEALLAFADSTPLAPAPAFAVRRHLFRRMVLISKEVVMTRKHLVAACAVMATIVATGSWLAVNAFPLQHSTPPSRSFTGPGPLEKAAKPVTPENPIPRRLFADHPDYPADLAGARASVTLRVTLDASGRVAEARPMKIGVTTPQTSVSVQRLDDPASNVWHGTAKGSGPDPAMKSKIDRLINTAVAAVKNWMYEPPADAPISFGIAFTFSPDKATTSSQIAQLPPARSGAGVVGGAVRPGPTLFEGKPAVRVGGSVKAPMKIRDVKPVYPEEARSARVQGVVIMEMLIAPDGTVSSAKVLRSIAMLDQAAMEAVLQWQFTPTLVDGKAVPVMMTATVNFRLQ